MAKRKKKRRGFVGTNFLKTVVANWLVRRTVLVLICFILLVNGAVAILGGGKMYLFSPFHIANKAQALGLYASHVFSQVGQPPMPSSKEALKRAVQRHGVSQRLVFAIAKAESDFVPSRVSHTGAMGLMQLMPDTAAELGVKDPFHPLDNADGGTRYLARLWKKYRGDISRIAAAYNYGPGRVPSSGQYSVPSETRAYVQRVIRYSKQL